MLQLIFIGFTHICPKLYLKRNVNGSDLVAYTGFGFWYFGHFSCVIFFPIFFRLAHLALQNVNKDDVIFLHFCNYATKSDQKPRMENGMNETFS